MPKFIVEVTFTKTESYCVEAADAEEAQENYWDGELLDTTDENADLIEVSPAIRDLETRNYKLAWGSGAGRGTFIIIRTADDKTTLRYTGSEGLRKFAELNRAFNISGGTFDVVCAAEKFEE